MNKADERQYVFQVFGAAAAEIARNFERPDFLITTRSQLVLGIEVTELFVNSGDAKLRHLADYSSNLLDQTQQIHRADKGLFEVDQVTLLDETNETKARILAIIQRMPSVRERIELLLARIAEKETKASKYLRNCQAVDLIIVDRSRLFSDIDHQDFFRMFYWVAPTVSFARSPFREIYVLTHTTDQKAVYFPLIGNLFVGNCFAFSSLLTQGAEFGVANRDTYSILGACLLQMGHCHVQAQADEHGMGFFSGAWEMYYAEDALHIRDWRLPVGRYPGERLTDMSLRAAKNETDKVREVVATRTQHVATVGLRFTANLN